MENQLKIVSISSEVAPFYKTGGLAEVAGNLPKSLKNLGHEVVAITPFYGLVLDKEKYKVKKIFENIKVIINKEDSIIVNYWQGYLASGLPVYFVENQKFFSRKKNLYGSEHENARFLVFGAACLKLLSLINFYPDIIHCHDWHSGLIPYFLKKKFRYSKKIENAKTVFTIHNLVFQMGHNWWDAPKAKKDNGLKKLPRLSDPEIENINFVKRGVLHADAITTVSEQYREEIMTKKYGQGMERILKNREGRIFGIVNGIDNKSYNPKNDPGLFRSYDWKNIEQKKANKEYLQKFLGMEINNDIPLIGLTSRVTFQKGFELIIETLDFFVANGIQLAVMGDGDRRYIKELKKYVKKYPRNIFWMPFSANQEKETQIYAGADIFLLPSHHEPCGINQLIAMRYGCIPVVRKVGGLYDTVKNYNPKKNTGTGFCFEDFDIFSLKETMGRALALYKNKIAWNELIIRAMQESHGWEIPAKKYETLFKKVIKG